MLSFLNAGLLPWIAAASVPVIIHLLTRRARRRADLPTMRFLQKSLANQSQVWKWRHFLTLLLRTLAIAALALAFMKPSWLSALAGPQGERAGVVVLLDVSESMAYNAGGVSSLTKGKGQAREVLQSLRQGDKANLIFCGAQPVAALETPSDDVTTLLSALQSAPDTEERTDGAGALGLAVEQLGKMNTKARRLYIVSDFQRTNWSDVRFESVPANTKILFVNVDSDSRENLGITALRTRPATPRIGEATTVQAEVFNSGPGQRQIPVELRLTDGRRFTEAATVGPYSSANVSFSIAFEKPERVELAATIPNDNLPADNTRRTVVDLQQMATVVMITDESIEAPTTAAFYLARALHPDPQSTTGFRVLAMHPKQLNNPILNSADAVIVCNAPSMPPIQYEALARYVTGGGNLMWFLYGDRMPEQLAAFGKKLPKAEPLPLHVESVANLESQAKGYVTLSEARYESRLLKAFRDAAATALTKAKFRKFCITSEVDARAELLLKFEDGTAAAVRTGEGSGNLLLINMSPAPSWSDLARQEIFVPLMHEFLKGILLKDSGQREAYPGGPAATTIAPTKGKLTCSGPDGDQMPVTQDKTTGSVVIEKTKGSGFYRLAADSAPVATLAVNPHADETDLRSIDPRELETKRQKQVSYLAGVSGEADVGALHRGLEIWPYLLALAMACLLGEQFVRKVRPKIVKGGTK